jgi:hypothetical protein
MYIITQEMQIESSWNFIRNVKQIAFWLKPCKTNGHYKNTYLHFCVHPTHSLMKKKNNVLIDITINLSEAQR